MSTKVRTYAANIQVRFRSHDESKEDAGKDLLDITKQVLDGDGGIISVSSVDNVHEVNSVYASAKVWIRAEIFDTVGIEEKIKELLLGIIESSPDIFYTEVDKVKILKDDNLSAMRRDF